MKAARRLIILLFILSSVPAAAATINDRWTVTFTERFRLTTWDNAITLDETAGQSRTFTRHRTQLGAAWAPMPQLTLNLQFGNEFRYHVQPATIDFHFDEIFVDQLLLRLNRPGDLPFSAILGRQNIMLGEGFVVMDGSPLDGSRSIYFDAARVDWHLSAHHRLIGFFMYGEETDAWLPVAHDQDQALVEQTETGAGAYFVGDWSEREIHAYFVHKYRHANRTVPFASSINTIGGRIASPLLHSIDFSAVAEAAVQFGSRGDADRLAFGGYGYARYRPAWSHDWCFLPRLVQGGVILLSGDKQATDDYEAWDPVFARWPKWSESYIYSQVREEGVAWWSNLLSINGRLEFALSPSATMRFDYHHLRAPRTDCTPAPFPGGSGATRGNLVIGKLMYTFDRRWSGHLLWEGFAPGDFYFDGADSYAWLRAELMYRL